MRKLHHQEIFNRILLFQDQLAQNILSEGEVYALIADLDRNELKELANKLNPHTTLYSVIIKRIKSMHELPLLRAEYKDLIKWYKEGTKGKVSDARTILKRRYDFLSSRERREIITAFLEKDKVSDRKWVYKKLTEEWDDLYTQQIKALWDKYHEKECALLIIKHFDLQFIQEHADDLYYKENSWWLEMRLAEDLSYKIDRFGMSAMDFLKLVYHSKRPVNGEEVRKNLFFIIAQIVNSEKEIKDVSPDEKNMPIESSTYDYDDVRKALWYIGNAGFTDVVIDYILWDYRLFNREQMEVRMDNYYRWIYSSPKVSHDELNILRDKLYKELYASVALHFPSEFKNMLFLRKDIADLYNSEKLKAATEAIDNFLYDQIGEAVGQKARIMHNSINSPDVKEISRKLSLEESKKVVNKLRENNQSIDDLFNKFGLEVDTNN